MRSRAIGSGARGLVRFGLAMGAVSAMTGGLAHAKLTYSGQITDFTGVLLDPTTITSTTRVTIGLDEPGSVTVDGDVFGGNGISSVFSQKLSIGDGPDGVGELNLTGFGASWNQDNVHAAELFLGFEGTGTLNISNSARLTSRGPAYLGGSSNVHSATGSGNGTGIINLSGASSQLNVEALHVGAATNGVGTMTVSNGAELTNGNNWVYVGYHANSTGSLIIQDNTTTHTDMWGMTIARSGRGNLTVRNGGQIMGSTSNQTSIIGERNGSLGSAVVTDNGSLWQDLSQSLLVGNSGAGILEIGRGGTVDYGFNVNFGTESTGRGQLVFNIGDDGTGTIESGLLNVGGEFGIGAGFGLFDLQVDHELLGAVEVGNVFTLVDYGTWDGDLFLWTNPGGNTAFLPDGGMFDTGVGVKFEIDYDADLDGLGDLGLTATVIEVIEPELILGDMDGNWVLDAFDVAPFELALADRDAYNLAHPFVDASVVGDFNGDQVLNAFDVAGFELALAGGGASVPEPATTSVFVLGLAALLRRRR